MFKLSSLYLLDSVVRRPYELYATGGVGGTRRGEARGDRPRRLGTATLAE